MLQYYARCRMPAISLSKNWVETLPRSVIHVYMWRMHAQLGRIFRAFRRIRLSLCVVTSIHQESLERRDV